jgi:AcrR family transcriptional regulator
MEAEEQAIAHTRELILAAAEQRFREYGYGKTTLAEIAKVADMSAANLYRFFENKLDIGAAVARRLLDAREAALGAALHAARQSFAERLHGFALAAVDFDRALFADSPPLARLLEQVLEERKDLAVEHRRAKQTLLMALVEEAIAAGEFRAADANQTAQAIRAALYLFDTPSLSRLYPPQEIERLAGATVGLLLAGLQT